MDYKSVGTKIALGLAAVGLGGAAAVTLVSDTTSQTAVTDREIFCNEFVPNLEASNTYSKFTRTAPLDTQRWINYRTAICSGLDPVSPTMATPFGKALAAAGEMATGVIEPPSTTTGTTTTTTTTTTTPPTAPNISAVSDPIAAEGSSAVAQVSLSGASLASTYQLSTTFETASLADIGAFSYSDDGLVTWKTPVGGSIAIKAGVNSFHVRVALLSDTLAESDEVFRIYITPTSNGGTIQGQSRVTITDASLPPPPPPGTIQWGINGQKWFDSSHNPARLGNLRASIARVEWGINVPASDLDAIVNSLKGAGIKTQPLAGFYGRIPSDAEIANLRNWALRHGPNGTNSISHIEFGNETTYGYQYGDGWDKPSYADRARWYARAVRLLHSNLSGTGVGILAQVDRGGGGTVFVDAMFAEVPDLENYVAGWVSHPYGAVEASNLDADTNTSGDERTQHVVIDLTKYDSLNKPVYFTEWGLASDNGRLLSANYGWIKNMTYAQEVQALNETIAMWNRIIGSRLVQVMYYQDWDQRLPGVSTNYEHYFGALKNDGTDKGAFSVAIRDVMDS